MVDEREVPGVARENNERLQERGYEAEFARLPEEEIDPIPRPGAGPRGGLDGGPRNLPLAVIAAGLLVTVLAFGVGNVALLAVGGVLVVVGGVWAGVRSQTQGSGAGVGRSTIHTDE